MLVQMSPYKKGFPCKSEIKSTYGLMLARKSSVACHASSIEVVELRRLDLQPKCTMTVVTKLRSAKPSRAALAGFRAYEIVRSSVSLKPGEQS